MAKATPILNGGIIGNAEPEVIPFTGFARSVECAVQSSFDNYRVVTLKIVDGKVVEKTTSDPFAAFEAIARLEIQMQDSTLALKKGYSDGKAWER